jgi:hypothetical protein
MNGLILGILINNESIKIIIVILGYGAINDNINVVKAKKCKIPKRIKIFGYKWKVNKVIINA